MRQRALSLFAFLALTSMAADASGTFGIYALIDRVDFEEATESTGERVRIWGTFGFFDRSGSNGGATGAPGSLASGFLYFELPSGVSAEVTRNIRNEWSDLASVAETGEAVSFFTDFYPGSFQPASSYLQVRQAEEPLPQPASYWSASGVVKLGTPENPGNHATLIDALRTFPGLD